MPDDPWNILLDILPGSLIGGAVMVAGAFMGWWMTRGRRGWLLQCTTWWFDRVVRPVLTTRSWAARAAIIAANNSLVCAALVVAGALGYVAWLAILLVGLALGTALRLVAEVADTFEPEPALTLRQRIGAGVGIVLNLLEPPAILASIGLALAQGALADSLALPAAGEFYIRFVLPILVVAAAGEALWLTIYGIHIDRSGQTATR